MHKSSAIQYVLLKFVDDRGVESAMPVIVLMLGDNGGRYHLEVFSLPNWDRGYQPSQSLYMAKAILEEWPRIEPSEAKDVFQIMCEASNGPFRAVEVGISNKNELQTKLAINHP
jgi:hypothetical protein